MENVNALWSFSNPVSEYVTHFQKILLGLSYPISRGGKKRKYCICYRFRIHSICGFATEVLRDFKKGQRLKRTQSHQAGEKQLEQEINPLEDPWGLQSFPLDNSERRPASSNLGRGLFILLGSNQGYVSLMVFMSLKVFHIWARSMLYGGPRRPCSQALGWADCQEHSSVLTRGQV